MKCFAPLAAAALAAAALGQPAHAQSFPDPKKPIRMQEEIAKWPKLIKSAKITAD